ncbi:MAG TPA: TIGR00725 family protein [Nitrospirae bacterium]|nr:DNA recombination-mediator protein A [bacterium BMS3Abin08]HDO35490.1 TIGR00725 family protein [Nitrospirota bacterium]HDY71619.1 TIGR00725 family protein [Nitrospirota bacterium]
MDKHVIGVIGGRDVDDRMLMIAEAVGEKIAKSGSLLLCGGLGGVMEAAAKGAKNHGGVTIGILPQEDRGYANEYIDIPVATGLGMGRNVIISCTADVLIAIGGGYGTLSEIAFALQLGKQVVGIETWKIEEVREAADAEDAVRKALRLSS